MVEKRDNYQLQLMQAKKLFLTYDQQELIRRCNLRHDEAFFYVRFLGDTYRVCRRSGDMQRLHRETWVDGNSFGEVMTILDWLCDSNPQRFVTGRWVNILNHGRNFHRNLQEDRKDPYAVFFDQNPDAFAAACRAMGGVAMPGGDVSFAIELVDGLSVMLQLWHGDEEFPPKLCCLWDENADRYIRYETMWYAQGLLLGRLRKTALDTLEEETEKN